MKKKNLCAAALAGLLATTACSSAAARTDTRAIDLSPAPTLPHTAADVHFMSGMIPHHAQAVLIAGWAATHGARSDVRILAERIVVGQRDEIALMQSWLRERGAAVPAADATHLRMSMNGMEHDMIMPGMLNEEELAGLRNARGQEFDRLFLTYMIRHHEGAITMVDQLFGSPGAAQDEVVFRFASDVYADQTTEIDRMLTMLDALPAEGSR
ncbi:MAG TPA: DUF305 domain-containing protein [Longimicrobiales bacterium]|nr:DUF305 domain-containing protein [Longimicrobiales bacterium]